MWNSIVHYRSVCLQYPLHCSMLSFQFALEFCAHVHSSQTPARSPIFLGNSCYHISKLQEWRRRRNTKRKKTHYYIAPFNIGIFSSHWMCLCPNWFICSTSIFNSFMGVWVSELTLIRLGASWLHLLLYVGIVYSISNTNALRQFALFFVALNPLAHFQFLRNFHPVQTIGTTQFSHFIHTNINEYIVICMLKADNFESRVFAATLFAHCSLWINVCMFVKKMDFLFVDFSSTIIHFPHKD